MDDRGTRVLYEDRMELNRISYVMITEWHRILESVIVLKCLPTTPLEIVGHGKEILKKNYCKAK